MENSVVFWNIQLNIKPGKLDELKELAEEMTTATRDSEPATINYEWSVDPEGKRCHIYERYTDSDAVRAHLGNFQAFAERFFDCLDVDRFHVYGNPDEQLMEALSGLGAQHLERLNGFVR